MNRNTQTILIILAIVFICLCAVCVLTALALGGLLTLTGPQIPDPPISTVFSTPTRTPAVLRPTESGETPVVQTDTLEALEQTIIPVNDPMDLASRLEGKTNVPRTIPNPPGTLPVGAQEEFWVTNVDTNQNFQITANLAYVTDHVYFWIEDGINYQERDVRDLAETFENQIYPTNRAFFGEEWSPGVDEDPHIYILLASGLGSSIAGYFSSGDEFHPLAIEFSNGHEMFVMNADTINLQDEFTYGVLAHEFQHMIHWNHDRNESGWLNEGFSQLATFLNDYDTGGSEYLYAGNTDMQLNSWPDPSQENTGPHYGAAFLFVTYFLDRFGEEATQALVAHPANGMTSVDAILEEIGATDPLTGMPITADDVFMDWQLANYLGTDRVGDGRYTYRNYPGAPTTFETDYLTDCGGYETTLDVHQYGADILRITCPGDARLAFEGSLVAPVLPEDPFSGSYAFWSNSGNESDMTLTQKFDFRNHSGPLTLSYWTWYDIEEDWDFVYLVASTDGENWEILLTPSGSAEDPTGNNYGWGYTGPSGSGPVWIQEEVDLSEYAGQEVTLRFEYITDTAVTGEGLLLDDIAIPEIGYFTDFERDEGGWEAEGFVRIQNALPQTYRLVLITYGDEISVEHIPLSEDNRAEIPLLMSGDVDEAVLIVSGTTRYTRQKAPYQLTIQP